MATGMEQPPSRETVLDSRGRSAQAYGSEGWGFESLRARHSERATVMSRDIGIALNPHWVRETCRFLVNDGNSTRKAARQTAIGGANPSTSSTFWPAGYPAQSFPQNAWPSSIAAERTASSRASTAAVLATPRREERSAKPTTRSGPAKRSTIEIRVTQSYWPAAASADG